MKYKLDIVQVKDTYKINFLRKTMTIYKVFGSVVLMLIVNFNVLSAETNLPAQLTEHQQWLKDKFNDQHTKLIPKVAVADVFFACNNDKNNTYGKYSLSTLITTTHKDILAEKANHCLAGEAISSNIAINYGLLGCFQDQFKNLPENERESKLNQVKTAFKTLSKAERQKSFTKCVINQSITYLK